MSVATEYLEVSRIPADELVRIHAPLVRRIAYHLMGRLPASVDVGDLIQAGMIGLLEAARNFSPTRAASFETYAGIRIRGAMLDELRKTDWTPRSVHRKVREVAEVTRQIESKLPLIVRYRQRIRFVPAGLGPFFTRRGADKVIELEWWAHTQLGGLTIHFVPSQHWSQRGPADKNETLWGGFVLEAASSSVYFAGDTAYFEGFGEIGRRFPGIAAALLPIGAYDPEWFMRVQHMNPEDAVKAFQSLGARLLCAMHWGTFKLTDEPLDEPPRLLEEIRRREQIPAERVWVAGIGESRRL